MSLTQDVVFLVVFLFLNNVAVVVCLKIAKPHLKYLYLRTFFFFQKATSLGIPCGIRSYDP
jgi:hypothetical protein